MFESNYSAPCLRRHVCRKIWKEFQNGKGWLSVLWRFHLSKCVWGFPGGSRCKQSSCLRRRCRFDPWGEKIPWRRKRKPVPVFLPGKSHGQKSLAGYSPWGCKILDVTEQLSTHAYVIDVSLSIHPSMNNMKRQKDMTLKDELPGQ